MKAGWEVRHLGQVCNFENGDRGKNYPGRKAFVPEGIPFINAGHIADGEIDWAGMNYIPEEHFERISRGKIMRGDILFCLRGSLGKFGHVTEPMQGAIASSLVIIRSSPDISIDFLKYFLRSENCEEQIEQYSGGAAQPNLGATDLKKFNIPLPPLDEQKRSVAVLDAAFEGLTRARTHIETNVQNARELFESGLLSIFGSLADPDDLSLLKEVSTTFGRGKSKHRPRNDNSLYGGEFPFIQTGDVRNSGHLIETYSQTYNDKGLAQSKLWPSGTVCITIAANIAETGVLAFDACFPDSIIGMVPDEKKTQSKYVEYLLQFFQKRLKALGEGAAQDNINLKTFETEYFPFPSLERQTAAVSALDVISEKRTELEREYRAKLQDLDDLRQSLLQKAFAGELT